MELEKTSVSDLFETHVQYKIPLFQRYYVWSEDAQWEPLWDDIVRQHSTDPRGRSSDHFIGTIVVQHQSTLAGDVPRYDIIDGQQRLTTFQIILCAIRDICTENRYTDMAREMHRYLQNQGGMLKKGEQYKLILTKRDRDAFISLVNAQPKKSRGKIYAAYSYFYDKMTEYVDTDTEKIRSLFLCIKDHFHFAQILIAEKDKPEKVFESLNRGAILFQFDLLRNNLFLRAYGDRDRLYEEYWEHFEDPYWGDPAEKGSGTSVNSFLQHFLMAQLGAENVEPEFFTYERKYLPNVKQRGHTTIEDEFSDLKRYSAVYREITDCEEDSSLGNRMRFYQTFNLTSLHPFVLYVACKVGLKGSQLDRVLHILESYTLRRMLCHRGTRGIQNFNKFFASLIRRLGDNFSLDNFIGYLSEETSYANRYPKDSEIRLALHIHFDRDPRPFPDSLTIMFPGGRRVRADWGDLWVFAAGQIRRKLMRYILYRIERMKMQGDKFTEVLAFEDKLTTLEHILPEEWKETWTLPVTAGSVGYDTETHRIYVNRNVQSQGRLYKDVFPNPIDENPRTDFADKSYEDAYNLAVARNDLLDSIGNLTLVTRELNSRLGNRTFAAKKKALGEHSRLKLNQEICAHDVWDINAIHERAEGLIADFCEIWPSLDWFSGESYK